MRARRDRSRGRRRRAGRRARNPRRRGPARRRGAPAQPARRRTSGSGRASPDATQRASASGVLGQTGVLVVGARRAQPRLQRDHRLVRRGRSARGGARLRVGGLPGAPDGIGAMQPEQRRQAAIAARAAERRDRLAGEAQLAARHAPGIGRRQRSQRRPRAGSGSRPRRRSRARRAARCGARAVPSSARSTGAGARPAARSRTGWPGATRKELTWPSTCTCGAQRSPGRWNRHAHAPPRRACRRSPGGAREARAVELGEHDRAPVGAARGAHLQHLDGLARGRRAGGSSCPTRDRRRARSSASANVHVVQGSTAGREAAGTAAQPAPIASASAANAAASRAAAACGAARAQEREQQPAREECAPADAAAARRRSR